jgi:Holliday junction resolvasome RuvABC endonuclease subunit
VKSVRNNARLLVTMQRNLKVIGLDMALANCGIASVDVCPTTLSVVKVNWLRLVSTQKDKSKGVKVRDDDFRRAREVKSAMDAACAGVDFTIAEIPGGSQSARGAKASGIVLGILTSCPVPLVEVDELTVKIATVGSKTATKKEMIEWAVSLYPDAGWLTKKVRGVVSLVDKNEHLADACAVIHAGLQTDHAKELLRLELS